ncbi:MAG TPA: pyruvate:ferredoxin (flavodoxin) oxidoreductase [Candidatus Binatia bacterium]|nr:pyruvate:ferredoxin (flavodoxin) oxidoreductase [Candidatus Binatia bacterium]
MPRTQVTLDGNEAVAWVAYHVSEIAAIYPITPSSPMGESSDAWSALGDKNIWGTVPRVIEMQSEAGAAGALHGAIQAGALGTTFTSAQGLLLMIPNMYKIAGELTPTVIHVAARSIAAHALSIFGDHQDAMAIRPTGFALLSSNSVQEAMDLALIAHAATLESRIPFLHFFDGFRTSHEVAKIDQLSLDDMRAMIDDDLVRAHRARALSPDHPVLRGSAQNPDVYFQGRESVNPYYLACPTIVQNVMDRFFRVVGREYRLFEYVGAPDAERVIVLMGSGAETAHETVDYLTGQGKKVGILKVRLMRPFSVEHFLQALPATVKSIAVLDRTKEPGAIGEPLYQDVVTALTEGFTAGKAPMVRFPKVIGGRYGLSSKEFTPAMVNCVFEELGKASPQNHFTIGINDDVTHSSLSYDASFSTEPADTVRAMFYGLGADGTVGANKNTIKIIGEETELNVQGYFVYDSKKSGAVTTSHLRFAKKPIRSTYLISRANFVACHQFSFMERLNVLSAADPGAVFLLNSPFGPDEVWDNLPRSAQEAIVKKKLRFYVIDAVDVARKAGMGGRINTVMQTCFFAISGTLPREEAIGAIKHSIEKTYGRRGESVVRKNFAAVDSALENLHEVKVPQAVTSKFDIRPAVAPNAPDFVRNVEALMMIGEGDQVPVSAMPIDGTFPTATTRWEKRNIALEIPVWDEELCIQCGKCVMVCPHAVIRAKVYDPRTVNHAPEGFQTAVPKWREFTELKYTLQVSPEDCTGCGLCVAICPAKSKSEAKHRAINMEPQPPLREKYNEYWNYFLAIPELSREKLSHVQVKDAQLLEPLFEFSGACAGCGETPYLSTLTRLFGDRALIANATGCSSIYGGNLPTTPYTVNAEGRGPAWNNSLFEDTAEFGMGMRLAVDRQNQYARELVQRLAPKIGDDLAVDILSADQSTEENIFAQRERVKALKEKLARDSSPEARDLLVVADNLVRKSVWIVGGDGWGYDIGYGGLDHVLASDANVNILLLDTEVYSNTGGQMSKATPIGAVAKFAAGGKHMPKKDIAMMAINYGRAYVAHIAMGGNDSQTMKAFMEADAYEGPSLIIAYSHCIAHGYDLVHGLDQQKLAVNSGHWPLFRYNPVLAREGKNPFVLDSRAPSIPLEQYIYNETRYTMLVNSNPDEAKKLLHAAQENVNERWRLYQHMANMSFEKK